VNLERAGYAVERATNGAEALVAIRRARPELVIADVMMPELDGFELLSVIRRDPSLQDIPVIVLVVGASGTDTTARYSGIADACLTKPFNPAALVAEIRRLLGEDEGGASGTPAPRTPPPPAPPAAEAKRPRKRRGWWEA
jgi:DNA-binding response OmpR family regulator